MARIALDVMGGDHAPEAPVAAALLAAQELAPSHELQLVGREAVIREELSRQLVGATPLLREAVSQFAIIDAPEVIEMTDKPSVAIRGKPRLQAEGQSDAFVSAGNTGAQMAASTFILRLHEGLSRPAIATVLPTARQPIVMLDAGANVDCASAELVQFSCSSPASGMSSPRTSSVARRPRSACSRSERRRRRGIPP